MLSTSWNDICNLRLGGIFKFNGAWVLNKNDLSTEYFRKYGTLENRNDTWHLSIYQNFKDEKVDNQKSELKYQTIYGVNFDGNYVEIIDAFDIKNNTINNSSNLQQETLQSRGVIFYSNRSSLNATYTDLIISFGRYPDILNKMSSRKVVELCEYLKIKDNAAKVNIISGFEGYLGSNLNFEFKFNKSIDAQYAQKVLVTLERLLEIFFGNVVSPTDVFLTNNQKNICKVFLPIDHSLQLSSNLSTYLNPTNKLEDLGTIIKNWFDLVQNNSKEYSLSTHYLANLTSNLIETDKLINLTEGIEGLYKGVKDENTKRVDMANKIKEYEKEIADAMKDNTIVLDKFNELKDLVNPIINKFSKKHSVKLLKKLIKFKDEMPTDAQELIEKLVTKNNIISKDKHRRCLIDYQEWVKSFKNTRVNITHGEDRYPKLADIEDVARTVDILSLMVRYFILNELGAPRANQLLSCGLQSLFYEENVWRNDLALNE